MKIFIAVLLTAVIVSSLDAQETTKPDTGTMPPPPTTRIEPLSPEPLTLIPDSPTTIPKPQNLSNPQPLDSQPSMTEAQEQLKKSKAAADADDLKERILFRQVKTRALQDPKIKEHWAAIPSAKTTREKITAFKQYYNLLYARMLRLDGSLKDRIEKSKLETLKRINEKSEFILKEPHRT